MLIAGENPKPWSVLLPGLNVVFTDHCTASVRSVMLKASRNSFVSTEYATGVSFSAVFNRPPARALVATKPTSLSVLTVKGDSVTASPLAGGAAGLAIVCAEPGAAANRAKAEEARTKARRHGAAKRNGGARSMGGTN